MVHREAEREISVNNLAKPELCILPEIININAQCFETSRNFRYPRTTQ
jgi:hypothetical protein